MKKIFFIIILSILLSFALFPNLVQSNGPPRPLSDLEGEIIRIIDFVKTTIVPYVGGFAIVVAGILFMFSGASPKLHEQAKEALIYIVVGFLIIWGAAEIVAAIIGL